MLINEEGEHMPQPKYDALRLPVDYIFIREDGWSLGSSFKLSGIADKMHCWVAVISVPSNRVRRYRYNGETNG